MRILTISGFVGAVMFVANAASGQEVLAPDACKDLWSKAGGKSDSTLTRQQAQPYVTDFTVVDLDKNGSVSSAEFMNGCQLGYIKSASASSGSSSSGSGSGTGSTGSGTSGSDKK